MYWDIVELRIEGERTLWVRFIDGTFGLVRFSIEFCTGVFEPLKDPEFFKQAFILDGVVTWPGDLDIAPDAMYHEIKKKWRVGSNRVEEEPSVLADKHQPFFCNFPSAPLR